MDRRKNVTRHRMRSGVPIPFARDLVTKSKATSTLAENPDRDCLRSNRQRFSPRSVQIRNGAELWRYVRAINRRIFNGRHASRACIRMQNRYFTCLVRLNIPIRPFRDICSSFSSPLPVIDYAGNSSFLITKNYFHTCHVRSVK